MSTPDPATTDWVPLWDLAGGGAAAPPDATTTVKGIIQLAGDLAGTAASPQIAAAVITDAEVAAANKDGAAATPSLRTLGTGANQAAPGNDTRITGAAKAASYGTSPPASPADGDEWILPAGNGVLWRFRYNSGSASAYKWEFLGGADLTASTGGTDTTTSGTIANLTNGPTAVLPRAGDYILSIDAVALNTVADAQIFLNVGDQATATNRVIGDCFGQSPSSRWVTIHNQERANSLAAGITIATKAWHTGGGTSSYQQRRLAITPVRVS